MSYVVEVHDCAGALGDATRETFIEAIEVARRARERWPGKAVTIINTARADDRDDGLTDAERDAAYAIEGGRVGEGWVRMRDIAESLLTLGFDAEDVREQMHGWVDDAVRAVTRSPE